MPKPTRWTGQIGVTIPIGRAEGAYFPVRRARWPEFL
jgi:hypothetical protein